MREKDTDEVTGPIGAVWQLFKVWFAFGFFLVLLSTCSGTSLPTDSNPLVKAMMLAAGGL